MKNGKNITELSTAIIAQARSKKDYLADTRNLRFTPDGLIEMTVGGQVRAYQPTPLCLDQIGARVGIPGRYVERMATEAPALLAQNVNHWFNEKPERRMLRTFDNGDRVARAFLSDKYRPLDNYDLATLVLPKLHAAGCEVRSAELTEKRLYIQAVTPRIQFTVERPGRVGDVVQAGVVISNSEVGKGSIAVEPLIFTLACLNGMIMPTSIRRHHVGRAGEGGVEADEAAELFSDETRRLDDKAFWAKVSDVTTNTLNEEMFGKAVSKLEAAARGDLGKPTEIVEITKDRFGLLENEAESVLEHLARGGDMSRYGLLNAVTRAAEDLPDYDRAIEFERIGGQILELSNDVWSN